MQYRSHSCYTLILLLVSLTSGKNRIDSCATDDALTLESGLTILHGHALCILQLVFLFALDTVVNISHNISPYVC